VEEAVWDASYRAYTFVVLIYCTTTALLVVACTASLLFIAQFETEVLLKNFERELAGRAVVFPACCRCRPLPPAAARCCRSFLPTTGLATNAKGWLRTADRRGNPGNPPRECVGNAREWEWEECVQCVGSGKWGSQWECVGMRGSAAAPWECVGIIASHTALRTGMGGDGNAWECVWECQAPLSRTP
jgi:hypothetical protein